MEAHSWPQLLCDPDGRFRSRTSSQGPQQNKFIISLLMSVRILCRHWIDLKPSWHLCWLVLLDDTRACILYMYCILLGTGKSLLNRASWKKYLFKWGNVGTGTMENGSNCSNGKCWTKPHEAACGLVPAGHWYAYEWRFYTKYWCAIQI